MRKIELVRRRGAIDPYAPPGMWPDESPPAKHRSVVGDLPIVTPAEFAARPLKPRQWIVESIIPRGDTTLVYGAGATGKSLLLLQLAMACAAGLPWLGKAVPPGRVLYVTCEDDADEVNRRALKVLAAAGIGWADLADRLAIVPMRESDASAVLATAKADGTLVSTPTYDALSDAVADFKPDILIVDTLADVFAGNENDRAHAKQFVKLIERLGCPTNLVTAHPSVSGMMDGRGASGSTGWPNAVRSHLYLERPKADGDAPHDPDLRVLANLKSNYAREGEGAIRMRWRDGVFVPLDTIDEAAAQTAQESKAEAVFVELLGRFAEQGRYVSASPGVSFAASVFADEQEARAAGVGKRALKAAMSRLFTEGRIVTRTRRVSGHDRGYLALADVTSSSTQE